VTAVLRVALAGNPAPLPDLTSTYVGPLLWRFAAARPVAAGQSTNVARALEGTLLRSLGSMPAAGQIALLAIPDRGQITAAGIALPRRLSVADRQRLRSALAVIERESFGGSMRLEQQLTATPWIGPARSWITVTPYVREGYAGRSPGDQRKLVRRSLRYILAPDDDDAAAVIRNLVQKIEIGEHPFAPDVRPAQDWPRTGATRPEHLRILFSEPVLGPLIVGRDRRVGLGLMRPAD